MFFHSIFATLKIFETMLHHCPLHTVLSKNNNHDRSVVFLLFANTEIIGAGEQWYLSFCPHWVRAMKLSKQKRGEVHPFLEVRLLYEEGEDSLFTGSSPKVLQAFDLPSYFASIYSFFPPFTSMNMNIKLIQTEGEEKTVKT